MKRRQFIQSAVAAGVAVKGAPAAVASRIVDTHTHFWDTGRTPPPGRMTAVPYANPNRPVLPPEYRMVAEPVGIKGTVLIEASGWLEDNDYYLDLAMRNTIIVGVIGNFGELFGKPNYDTVLNRLAANPLFRGIRLGDAPTLAMQKDAKLKEKLGHKAGYFERRRLAKGGPEDWAWQSRDVSRDVVYANLPAGQPAALSDDYFKKALPSEEQQLRRAGVRLAKVLNETLGQ